MTEIRDHITKIELDQGPNDKKMLEPGTIAPLMQSLSCILLSRSPFEYSRLTTWSSSESLSKLCFPIYLAHFLCKYKIIICFITIQINFIRHLIFKLFVKIVHFRFLQLNKKKKTDFLVVFAFTPPSLNTIS